MGQHFPTKFFQCFLDNLSDVRSSCYEARSLYVVLSHILVVFRAMLGSNGSSVVGKDPLWLFDQVSIFHNKHSSGPTKYRARPFFHKYCVLTSLSMVGLGRKWFFGVWGYRNKPTFYRQSQNLFLSYLASNILKMIFRLSISLFFNSWYPSFFLVYLSHDF